MVIMNAAKLTLLCLLKSALARGCLLEVGRHPPPNPNGTPYAFDLGRME